MAWQSVLDSLGGGSDGGGSLISDIATMGTDMISGWSELIGGWLGGREPWEEIQSSMYDIFDPLEHDIRRTLEQSMQLQGKRDPKTGEITKPAYLPPALQYAVDSMKRMADLEVVGGIDELTRTGVEGLDQISETLTARGDITGGQRTQMQQQLRDRVLDAMLKTRRAGAAASAGYEADIWSKFYGSGLDTARFSAGGFQVPVGPSGFEKGAATGAIAGSGLTALLESAAGLFAEPQSPIPETQPPAQRRGFWEGGGHDPYGTYT